MEPTLPTPHGSPEVGPVLPRGPEGPFHHTVEQQRGLEQSAPEEQRTGSGAGDTPPPSVPVVPLPLAPAVQTVAPPAPAVNDNPLVAADEDLIEKEWVEKAKKVISETKNDPYAQEQAVSRLQADYLNKRYGKVVKLPLEE